MKGPLTLVTALCFLAGTTAATSSLQTLLERSATQSQPNDASSAKMNLPAGPGSIAVPINAMLGSSDSFVRQAAEADFSLRMRKRSHAPSHLEDTPAESAMQNVADMPRENATGQSARSVNPAIARRDERFAEKRWIISPTIIQDDTPLAPPIGPNVNILGSSSIVLNTPTAALVAPSFPPRPPTFPSLSSTVVPSPPATFVAAAIVPSPSASSLPAITSPRAAPSTVVSPSVSSPVVTFASVAAPPAAQVSKIVSTSTILPVTTPFFRNRHTPKRLTPPPKRHR